MHYLDEDEDPATPDANEFANSCRAAETNDLKAKWSNEGGGDEGPEICYYIEWYYESDPHTVVKVDFLGCFPA